MTDGGCREADAARRPYRSSAIHPSSRTPRPRRGPDAYAASRCIPTSRSAPRVTPERGRLPSAAAAGSPTPDKP